MQYTNKELVVVFVIPSTYAFFTEPRKKFVWSKDLQVLFLSYAVRLDKGIRALRIVLDMNILNN